MKHNLEDLQQILPRVVVFGVYIGRSMKYGDIMFWCCNEVCCVHIYVYKADHFMISTCEHTEKYNRNDITALEFWSNIFYSILFQH